MIRLHFVVEGQTEETFVRDILAPELATRAVIADAHRITTGRKRGRLYRGGSVAYAHLHRDLTLWMKQDRGSEVRFTTMIDLYRLPSDFPGLESCGRMSDPVERAKYLESKLTADVDDGRLIPYIQLHEFEGLLFSNPEDFIAAFPSDDDAIGKLKRIRDAFPSPEHINDGATTAPSKRICEILPTYAKTSYGLAVAKAIGLAKMRAECKHFDSWFESLSLLGND